MVDFDSKIYFFNFGDDFDQFNYKGDYSKLSLYDVKKNNYSLNIYGRNTALNMDSIQTTFGAIEDKKVTKILEKKANESAKVLGNIDIELINGIVNVITQSKGN